MQVTILAVLSVIVFGKHHQLNTNGIEQKVLGEQAIHPFSNYQIICNLRLQIIF